MIADPLAPRTPWEQPWTLAAPLDFAGVGLHAGKAAGLRLVPAPAGHGIVFHRVDLPGAPAIPARAERVTETTLSTTLGVDGQAVHTVEHLMAALWGMGISDARVEVDGPEVPILDGSALPFARAIAEAGVSVLPGRRPIADLAPSSARAGEKLVAAVPDGVARLTCAVDFGHPFAGAAVCQLVLSPAVFLSEVAPARTFGFLKDVEALRARGLARGGSAENAVVILDDGYSSPLRFPDELVRHKLLDAVGDLALLGVFWRGHVVAVKAGHALHNAWARQACMAAPAHAGAPAGRSN